MTKNGLKTLKINAKTHKQLKLLSTKLDFISMDMTIHFLVNRYIERMELQQNDI